MINVQGNLMTQACIVCTCEARAIVLYVEEHENELSVDELTNLHHRVEQIHKLYACVYTAVAESIPDQAAGYLAVSAHILDDVLYVKRALNRKEGGNHAPDSN